MIKDGEAATILLDCVHRDPEAWEEDADEFKPEMLEESFNKLSRNAWKVSSASYLCHRDIDSRDSAFR